MAKKDVQYFEVDKFRSLAQMMEQAEQKAPDSVAYRYRENGEVKDVTFSAFNARVRSLGAFLHSLGLDGEHIACVGPSSIHWLTVYFTVLRSAGVFVPIDKDLPLKDMVNVIAESDATVLFCAGKYEDLLKNDLPDAVRCVICFDRQEDEGNHLSFSEALRKGEAMDSAGFLNHEENINGLKMIVFTSGTTGMAKGVMLSEKNLVSSVYYGLQTSRVYDVGLSILPYHHTYEAVSDILISYHNHSTLCINENMMTVLKNLQAYKPSYVYVVPAVAEMFYTRLMRSFAKDGKDKDLLKLIAKSNAARKVGIDIRPEVFQQVREIFGGNLKKIVCGGAAVRPTVAKFFDDIGIDFVNGYGITECSPLVTVNNDNDIDVRTAGIKLPCIDLDISLPNDEGVGEICVRGPIVMMGYYKHPEMTAEVIRNGWFLTGDYGYITEDGHLIVCGRKKNVIVLSNGKNIYPEEIEGYIQNIDYVNEVVVSSDFDETGNEASLAAEVFLSEVKTAPEVLKSIKKVCKDLPIYKQISRVIIRDSEFEKTTTNKIKRFGFGKKKAGTPDGEPAAEPVAESAAESAAQPAPADEGAEK